MSRPKIQDQISTLVHQRKQLPCPAIRQNFHSGLSYRLTRARRKLIASWRDSVPDNSSFRAARMHTRLAQRARASIPQPKRSSEEKPPFREARSPLKRELQRDAPSAAMASLAHQDQKSSGGSECRSSRQLARSNAEGANGHACSSSCSRSFAKGPPGIASPPQLRARQARDVTSQRSLAMTDAR
jgi:hypothetical protein